MPIFDEDWGADEETLLLEGAETYGLGSWADIADHIGGYRDKDEVRDHYINTYVNTPKFPLPERASPKDLRLTEEWPREKFQARKKQRIEEKKEKQKNAPPAPPKQKPTSSVPSCHEVQGYMPGRLEFETEFINEAEEAVQHMQFEPGEADFKYGQDESEMELKMTIMDIYNNRLTARVEKKRLIFEHQLLEYRKNQAAEKKKTKEERDLFNRAKPFARLMNKQDFDEFAQGLEHELNLRQAISQLQDWRKMAIGDLETGRQYEQEKQSRLARQASLSGQFNHYASTRAKPLPPSETAVATQNLTAPSLIIPPVSFCGKAAAAAPLTFYQVGPPTPPYSNPSNSVDGDRQTNGLSSGMGHAAEVNPHNIPIAHRPKFQVQPLTNAAPFKFHKENAPDLHLLTEDEQDVCSNLRLMPRHYLAIKDIVFRESQKRGGLLKKKELKEICRIDTTKAGRVFDFFVHSGWIAKS